MENKKITTVVGIVILIIIVGTVLYFVQKARETNAPTPTPAPVAEPNKPVVTPKDDKETLPTVEMGNAVGVVQSITSDSLTVKTDKEEITLSIKGTFNVFAFTDKGSEQKSLSDVKTGSKVSVQYSKDKVVMSMYLMK